MASAKCKGCGRMTNSTTSDLWHTPDHIPTKCWAAWDEGKNGWVKGCAYDEASAFEKKFCDEIIRDSGVD